MALTVLHVPHSLDSGTRGLLRTGSWTGPPRKIRALTPLTPNTVEPIPTLGALLRHGLSGTARTCTFPYVYSGAVWPSGVMPPPPPPLSGHGATPLRPAPPNKALLRLPC